MSFGREDQKMRNNYSYSTITIMLWDGNKKISVFVRIKFSIISKVLLQGVE
jgi:hypothetical protein